MTTIRTLEDYLVAYRKSVTDPESYWQEKAEDFFWHKKWDTILEWNFEDYHVNWFKGGKLNITENCLDRHLFERSQKTAIIWEPNNPDEKQQTFTYLEVHEKVCKFANILKSNGIKKGDRVCIYMPMLPELAFSVLACARVGAIHSVVFAGFSAESLASRIQNAKAKIVITADFSYRGKKETPLKSIVDKALEKCSSVKTCLTIQRTGSPVNMKNGRDIWYHEELLKVDNDNKSEIMDSEDPLFILYTSGSTGKPKGILHSIAGYMVYIKDTFQNVFQYNENDTFWCSADIGWVTGHSYIIYGPLLAGATTVLFEGIPTYPDAGRFWSVIEKYKINQFYTAPTAIRALMVQGTDYVTKYDLSSLKVIGTVGEPINEEAWKWYHTYVGKGKCPIVDTWWQTETGGMMISPLAGITPTKPTYATLPLPGIQPIIVDHDGHELKGNNVEGNLCIKFPWPSILRTIYGDHERCKQTYFSTYKGYYFTGDGCKRDEEGYYRILGRVDDVINVSGHRLGTAEIENAINQEPKVFESAVVGYPHDIKGQGIYAFAIAQSSNSSETDLKKDIITMVNNIIGPIAKPDKIQIVTNLPKTRSGKIMRRILRKIASGDNNFGDTSTLLNPDVIEEIIKTKL